MFGMWRAIVSSQQVAALPSEYERLAKTIRHMPIKDPKKVYVLALPKEGTHVWRFRVYLPAHYEATDMYYNGRISATTPRIQFDSGGSGWNGARAEPVDYLLTIAFFKETHGWELHKTSDFNRCSISLGPKIAKTLENSESLIVEYVGQNGPAEFSIDEPICLMRLRNSDPIEDKNGAEPLYEGFYLYIIPKSALQEFKAVQRTDP